ncbi:deoxyribonuclease-1 isoform X1 [Gracilinanus agilis]|uniref:deoxyribonuclease-1 isoform X1 n=1 Tax=Gracilinanus agilis TaxID=191870 RepID=UPI001CFDCAB8|nr:deoxyribonuclease-1 isoform X1 [Gracilinanus agilis]
MRLFGCLSRCRTRAMKPIASLLCLACLLHVALCLRIAAFNIRTFGENKMSNDTISDYIVRILNQYDIALVQEVRDKYLVAVGSLLDKLNRETSNSYHFVVSEPLGRNTYKERYLFVFRPDKVSVLDSYYYDDGCLPCGNDTFSREPVVVKFSSPTTGKQHSRGKAWAGIPKASLFQAIPGHVATTATSSVVKEFVIVPLHAAPKDAVTEIDALFDVYLDVRLRWNMEDIMFMGDFNADCSYVTPSQWPSIRLRNNSAFQWLIPDTADTTVTPTDCAYDRIVVSGRKLQSAIVPGSATIFDFQAAYNLSTGMALAISDHYPVEVTLK